MIYHVGMSSVSRRKIDVLQQIDGVSNIFKFNVMIIRFPCDPWSQYTSKRMTYWYPICIMHRYLPYTPLYAPEKYLTIKSYLKQNNCPILFKYNGDTREIRRWKTDACEMRDFLLFLGYICNWISNNVRCCCPLPVLSLFVVLRTLFLLIVMWIQFHCCVLLLPHVCSI